MRGRRLTLALGLALAATGYAGAGTVRITFEGSCDFIYQATEKGTLVTVVLPASEPSYGGMKLAPHEPFMRLAGGGVVMLKPSKITFDNVSRGFVDTSDFDGAVYKMEGKPAPARIDKGVSIQLPKGRLRAVGGYGRWVVMAEKDLMPADVKTRPMASSAVFEFETTDSEPFTIRTSAGAEIRVPFQNELATVTIGNLQPKDIFFNGRYDSICVDHHYGLHYTLLDPSKENGAALKLPRWVRKGCDGVPASAVDQDTVPASTAPVPADVLNQPVMAPKVKPSGDKPSYGPRDDCFMARWDM
jgi:hypothetical protein